MKKILTILAIASLAFACQKEPEVTPSVTLNTPSEVTVKTEGEIITVEFQSTVAWTASIDNSSFNVTPTSGEAGTATVKVTALQNDSEDAVVANLTITAQSANAKVKFTQLQKDALIVEVTEKEIDCNEQDFYIDVKSNVDYTAKVADGCDWMIVSEGTKAAVASQIHVGVDLNKGEAREGSIIISGAGKNIEFVVKQAAFEPVFEVSSDWFEMGVEGGQYEFDVTANVEYAVKTYEDGSFPYHHVTRDGNHFTVTVDANPGYDVRQPYIKFTIDEIQDPVLDDNGEPTGETTAHEVRVYCNQAGRLALGWRQEFTWDLYNESHRYSVAMYGDYMFVCTGIGMKVFSKTDGSFLMDATDMLPFIPTGITNDDAGNIVLSVGGNYPLTEDGAFDEEVEYIPLDVYAIPAGKLEDPTAIVKLVDSYSNGFYGYGLDNIRVTGDVTKDACITMVSAAGYDGGSYAVAFEIKNGTPVNTYADYVTLPTGGAVWSSANMVAKHLGTTVDSGIFYIGYDTHYDLCYNPTMSMANWQHVLVTGSSWAEGYNAIDFIEWNGHKYASFIGMTYFGKVDWGVMPSYLWLVNIDDPANPVTVSCQKYYISDDPGSFVYGSTTDVCLEIEGDNLVAYVFDSGVSCFMKVIYPKL